MYVTSQTQEFKKFRLLRRSVRALFFMRGPPDTIVVSFPDNHIKKGDLVLRLLQVTVVGVGYAA